MLNGSKISVAEAKELQNFWIRTRAKTVDAALKYTDCREFWFSLDELAAYLEEVKAESETQKAVNPGIRVYLGAKTADKKPDGIATVFFAPTKEVNGKQENNYEIAPYNQGFGGNPPHSY